MLPKTSKKGCIIQNSEPSEGNPQPISQLGNLHNQKAKKFKFAIASTK